MITTLIIGFLAFIFLITTLIFINKYKTSKQNIPEIKQLEEKTPNRKENETDLQYLKRCAMRFQNEIAREKAIMFTEDGKMYLNIIK